MSNCPSCNSTISPDATLCRSCGASLPDVATARAGLERELRSLLDQGKKIEAVKVFKDQTGSSLIDAKHAVEALLRDNGLTWPMEADTDLKADACLEAALF